MRALPGAVLSEAQEPTTDEFRSFAAEMEPRLRFALAGSSPPEVVREAVQDALVYAWSHWDRVTSTSNPGGYLYRVAKRRTWRQGRVRLVPADPPADDSRWVEPGLDAALGSLSDMQRKVVYLIEGLGLSQREVADLLSIRRSSVRTHLERALKRLRQELGVQIDV